MGEPPFYNSGLFSDYYLSELLKNEPEWKADLSSLLESIRTIYLSQRDELPHLKESSLEERFIRPLLNCFGHSYETQPQLPPGTEGFKQPDYALFTDNKTRSAALSHQGKEKFFQLASGICEVKSWGRPLDKKLTAQKGTFEGHSPSWQISQYLWRSGVKWGILTDGRWWRLYERESSKRLDVHYQVDLPALLESQDLEAFKYFGLFFRKEAFPTFLEKVQSKTIEYARAVGEGLKKNVYKALQVLCQGFIDNPANRLTPADIELIRANAFIFLYRLLFIFYAEARELLPVANPAYRDTYSLRCLRDDVKQKLDDPNESSKLSRIKYAFWEHLKTLFDLINRGSEAFGISRNMPYVPPYNGGLFDREAHAGLETWRVGDSYLAPVIDLLARAGGKAAELKAFVSYKDLEIRHLGSIYEGLLEYKLKVADEEMVPVREKSKEVYVPLKQAEKENKKLKKQEVVPAGQLYLATDKGERKSTGSYYTPDYIVKYIVQNTLGPLIKEKEEKVKAEVKELRQKVKAARGYNRQEYERQLAQAESSLIDGILSLKVLDPAMGSGHFLVEATDFLAHALVDALGGSAREEEEEDVRWARREVVEKCIYGVDLNPLAVELAKLSLWLSTVAKNKPLNFLDHHLRSGNALIGAWASSLGAPPRAKQVDSTQLNLFAQSLIKKLPIILGKVAEILRTPSDNVEQIHEKQSILAELLTVFEPFRGAADLWTSGFLGNPTTGYDNILVHLGGPHKQWQEQVAEQDSFINATRLSKQFGFFHWELEFPEAFYEETKEKKEPGFDALIGNPPYIRIQSLSKDIVPYFNTMFRSAYKNYDIYVLFVERGFNLLNDTGRFGFILPNKFFHADYGQALRGLLSKPSRVYQILDFGDNQVFAGSTTYTNLMFLTREEPEAFDYYRIHSIKPEEELETVLSTITNN